MSWWKKSNGETAQLPRPFPKPQLPSNQVADQNGTVASQNQGVPISGDSNITVVSCVSLVLSNPYYYYGISSVSLPASMSTQAWQFAGQQANHQNGVKPRCAVCNKPVSYCQVMPLADPASVKVKTLCHGEEETKEVPSDGLNGDAKVPAGYVAFAEKAAALLRARLPEVQETKTVRLITLEE